MHAIKTPPPAQSCSPADHVVERASQAEASSSASANADVALVAAVVAPLTIVGLLALGGVGVATAVCIMFVSVFAVTTTLDVKWLVQRRRARSEVRRDAE